MLAQPAGLVAVETGRRAEQLDREREPVLVEGRQVLGPAPPDPGVAARAAQLGVGGDDDAAAIDMVRAAVGERTTSHGRSPR